MEYTRELNRYLNDNIGKYDENVILYAKDFVKRIKHNNIIKEFFIQNNIGIYSFLYEFLPSSQYKLNIIDDHKLDEVEINQIFGKVMLNNEIFYLLLTEKISINGLNEHGELVYELSDDAWYYFNTKYGIKLNKIFSMRDILILNIE